MLISLLLLNATKSKLYVHVVCFWFSLSIEHVCIVLSFLTNCLLYCIILHCICIYFLISGCCKSCLQPSMPCSTAWLTVFLLYLLSKKIMMMMNIVRVDRRRKAVMTIISWCSVLYTGKTQGRESGRGKKNGGTEIGWRCAKESRRSKYSFEHLQLEQLGLL